ncbi:basic proline-rich protein-like [Canis lupus dingo]|uniref:basic proline-rich protein-like n=1 Tax=Canis lupus dingo TaxID=286419 RepID=UPI000DC6C904|nr:basic proline-rich protein-like [Canis lupus dingo]
MDMMVRLSKPLRKGKFSCPLPTLTAQRRHNPKSPSENEQRARCGRGNAKTREGESPGSPPPQTHCGVPGGAARRAARVVQLRPELAGCPQDAPRAPAGCPQDAPRAPPRCPPDASRMPPRCTTGAPRMLPGCLQDAPRAPPGCSSDVSRMPPGAPRMLPGCPPPRSERKRQPTGPPAEAAAPSRVPPQDRRGPPPPASGRRGEAVQARGSRGSPAARPAPRAGLPGLHKPARLPRSQPPPPSVLIPFESPFRRGRDPGLRLAASPPRRGLSREKPALTGEGRGGRAEEDSGEHENRAAAAARRAVASAPPAAANGTPPLPACPAHAARLPPGHVTRSRLSLSVSLPPPVGPPTSAPPLSLRSEEGA